MTVAHRVRELYGTDGTLLHVALHETDGRYTGYAVFRRHDTGRVMCEPWATWRERWTLHDGEVLPEWWTDLRGDGA